MHDSDDDRLLQALHQTDSGDLLDSLDYNLSALISEKGRSISGGQRQRVALARALVSRAPILALVEPTSAVDSNTEARIALGLVTARSGLTTVIATTSPLLLSATDTVVLLDNHGKVLAQGPHEQLRHNPEYQELISREMGL